MGGKGSGRKATYKDLYHKLVREHQLKYDREIASIMKNHNCSFKEARRIRKQRKRTKKK